MSEHPVELRPVADVAALAADVVDRFRHDVADVAGIEVHHIGATALPGGHTKGDVDVNVRVAAQSYTAVVAVLGERYEVAQPENWTPTFASFSCAAYELPLGLQVTRIGSPGDFLLALNERIRASPELSRRYDEVKLGAAPNGRTAYWEAKNAFLQELLAGQR